MARHRSRGATGPSMHVARATETAGMVYNQPTPAPSRHPARAGVATARFWTASLALELGVLLALSILFPYLIHILPVPEDARLGARLLPMFYAPLLAALIGRMRPAVAVAVLAPWLNLLITGYPRPAGAWILMTELLVFVAVLRLLLPRLGPRWLLAVPAYVAGMAAATVVVALFPATIGGRPVLPWLLQSVVTGLPGVVVLVAISWLVIRNYPTGSNGDGPLSA